MLQRASVASLVCLVVASISSTLFAQTKDRSIPTKNGLGSVMVSSPRFTNAHPKVGTVVPTDNCQNCQPPFAADASEGTWEWVRNPLQERRRTVRIYNLHCVRCHGVNGRGVWDIPDVPDFTDECWQLSRSDADIVRLTLGGRGACMPAFRGTITRSEACAIARYIRTFAQVPAERPPSKTSTSVPIPRSTSGVTYRPPIRQPTNLASRPNVPRPSIPSKHPLHWINPFSKKQASGAK